MATITYSLILFHAKSTIMVFILSSHPVGFFSAATQIQNSTTQNRRDINEYIVSVILDTARTGYKPPLTYSNQDSTETQRSVLI